MGLSAIVYKSIDSLTREFPGVQFEIVDPATSEACPMENRISRNALIAAKARLGNLAMIGILREAAKPIFAGADSVILNKILHSALHSGDTISMGSFAKLKDEVALLKKHNVPNLAKFIDGLVLLLSAGEGEHNPIVFV
jgi:hypothetical protein